MADINRTTTITLPPEVSNEILQKTQDDSAVMALARQITIPGTGVTVPVITGDPSAAWVTETAAKPVSNPGVSTKQLTPYKLAVIETFSNEFVRDAAALYDALVARLPLALANKFDNTVIGGTTKPGDNFEDMSTCTSVALTATTAYTQLVTATSNIATAGGIVNGFAISPQCKAMLLSAVDGQNRPLFINSVADGAIPQILGAPTIQSKGMYKAKADPAPAVVGIVGDWTQAVYGTVEGVQIAVSDQATLTTGSTTINLWQNNMVAVRAEIEIGFRADTSCFNLLTIA